MWMWGVFIFTSCGTSLRMSRDGCFGMFYYLPSLSTTTPPLLPVSFPTPMIPSASLLQMLTYLPSSDGQQTLGVALPWAISASLTQSPPCSEKVISVSGDGGFMFSSQELSTAVLQGCNITHFIWNDSAYNMVEFQEVMKYGRSSGVKLGGVDFVKFAESFGAKGLRIEDSGDVERVIKEAVSYKGVCLVDVRIDYSENVTLAGHLIQDEMN